MRPIRMIARLDVKGLNLVKTVQLEGLRQMGDPSEYALKYYNQGADELIYLDIVASLYRRSNLTDIIVKTTDNVFVPVSAGGGIRSVDDCTAIFNSGADKIAINTFAVESPDILSEISQKFGSQALVLSIEAKLDVNGQYRIYTDCGREWSKYELKDWVREACAKGVGEIMVTSIDREGTKQGYDTELISQVASVCDIPIIASGGFGELEHVKMALEAGADAIAVADRLHFNHMTCQEIKQYIASLGYEVRL